MKDSIEKILKECVELREELQEIKRKNNTLLNLIALDTNKLRPCQAWRNTGKGKDQKHQRFDALFHMWIERRGMDGNLYTVALVEDTKDGTVEIVSLLDITFNPS